MMHPAHVLREGEVIASKYALEERLGQGGMGTVWAARNLPLDARVAIKLVRPELEATEVADLLLDEARIAANVEHPGIVRIFDFGMTDDGVPFLVMEHLDGQSLGDLMRSHGRISAITAVQILLPVIDALVSAHERGIVHRDLTPENIFLSRMARRIQPKIVDFGIALRTVPTEPWIPLDGSVVGTPRYMSPEQASGDEVDHRSDLWTVSAVLYEAVAGCPAFKGSDAPSVLKAVVGQPATPLPALGVSDPALWEIVDKGLTKQKASRWQSASSLGAALARWLFDRGAREDICGSLLAEVWLSENDAPESDSLLRPREAP